MQLNYLNKLTSLAEWSELGGILAIAIAIIQLGKYFQKRLSLKKSLAHNPRIIIELDTDIDDKVELVYQTYKPNNKKKGPFENWIPSRDFKVSSNESIYKLNKNDLYQNLERFTYPYKFHIKIPNTRQCKEKYYARLLSKGYIVTGRGSLDPNRKNIWRIYFLHADEPWHKKEKYLWNMKHSLIS